MIDDRDIAKSAAGLQPGQIGFLGFDPNEFTRAKERLQRAHKDSFGTELGISSIKRGTNGPLFAILERKDDT